MARPAKSININSAKMSNEERVAREKVETNLKGSMDKLKPSKYLNTKQKKIFKAILAELEDKDILGNLDLYVLNQTVIAIERLEAIETNLNQENYIPTALDLKMKDMYSKDFFRCCNELCLSPQARAKLSISVAPPTKKTLADILADEEADDD